ncbi:MAG: DNA repair protein RadA [Patescibacteria group bacterium]
MADKLKTVFTCSNCDAQFPKWSGRCTECGSWGTLGEQAFDGHVQQKEIMKKIVGAEVLDLNKIQSSGLVRQACGLAEIDRVLGGGLVSGSLLILAGEPGIGKSTLVAQLADAYSKDQEALYVSGEESASQVKSRLERLHCDLGRIKFVSETNVEKIVSTAIKLSPKLLIIDSIQTIYSALIPAEAGSVSQIRAGAVKFLELAKQNDISVILIGHITKDGQVAGPKSLEHIVDTVLYLENEAQNNYCLLRASKNRFGSVNELGVLEMTGQGFKEVKNPSLVFIESAPSNLAGSVIGCVLEGTRPFLVEVQALVSKTVFGYPQRKSSGFDLNRLQVLSAVLSKRTKTNLTVQDIILNIVGGLKISDPALDLAVAAAIISSHFNKSLDRRTIVLGEVGLGGEVRAVHKLEQRLAEAEKLGFTAAIIPNSEVKAKKIKLLKIKSLSELEEIIK